MSDKLEVILLTNVPIFVDDWLLKSTTSHGDLIHSVAKNPVDPSKVVLLTEGQDNARKIAAALNNYNLFGSIIQAWYAFIKPPEDTNGITDDSDSSRVDAKDIKQQGDAESNGIQANIEKKSNAQELDVHYSKKLQKPLQLVSTSISSPRGSPHSSNSPRIFQTAETETTSVQDKTQKLPQGRKRRSSTIVDSTETREVAGRDESAGRSSMTSNRGSSRRKDSQGRDTLPDSKQDKDSSRRKSRRCRFCHLTGHATWLCKERPEYYKVGRTTQGINPPGCQWPESCIVKVEELCAGPIIEYIETRHLHNDKMNGEEIRIMFAWLTSYVICYNCGAAGHSDTEGMCKYLPLDRPVTHEEIAQFRTPLCRRMKGIRDKVSFGKIQHHARRANQEFRDRMDGQDGRPLKCSEKKKEKTQKGCSTEPIAPGEKRSKTVPEDYETVTDDDEDQQDEKACFESTHSRKT